MMPLGTRRTILKLGAALAGASAASAATEGGPMAEGDRRFASALRAAEPAPGLAGKLGLYGQFVGSWVAEAQAFLADGSTRTHFWQIHFAWVLEGRAIQDVWITPPRGGSRARESQAWGPFTNQYGTTLRVYDPALDAWRVTWIDPAASYRADLLGRADGDGIFQEGTGSDGARARWIFSDIARRSFRWRAELSRDQGANWYRAIELLAERV